MHPTVKKYLLVVFITLLVWIWANNAMETKIDVSASITTVQTGDSDILAIFDRPMPLNVKITVTGSSSKVADFQKLIASGQENLDFVYSLQNDLKGDGEAIPLDTAKWLNQSLKIKTLGLTVESAEPAMVQVTIEKLEKKELAIECFDEDGIAITADSLNPSTVNIFVKQGWVAGGARIDLTATDVENAQKDYVIKKPYVQLAPGDFRYGELVTVKLPSTELDPIPFQPRNIFFAFSGNLQGKYSVKLINENELTGMTTFKASDEAMDAYKNSAVHIIVPVLDGQENQEGVISAEVIYNFPPEDFAAGKIRLAKPPVKARFELIKITSPAQ